MTRSTTLLSLIAAVLVALLGATACGSSSSTTASSSAAGSGTTGGGAAVAKVPSIAAMLPSSASSSGGFTVAVDASYPPNEYVDTDGSSLIGWDIDLGHALGQVLGVPFNFKNVTFDAIIPGLAAQKYQIGMSSFTDTKAREKVVDFVTYFKAGSSFYVKASGGADISGIDGICGHSVAVETGTTEQDDVTAQSTTCTNAGKPAVTVHAYPTQTAANLALSSGKADAVDADSVVSAYVVKTSNGQFKLSGKPYGVAPYGIALPKDSGLAKPVLAALQHLMKTGIYQQILHKWGVQFGAISNPGINQAVS